MYFVGVIDRASEAIARELGPCQALVNWRSRYMSLLLSTHPANFENASLKGFDFFLALLNGVVCDDDALNKGACGKQHIE